MESDDDVPLILTWDEANSGLLNEDTERGDESKFLLSCPHSHNACMARPMAVDTGFGVATVAAWYQIYIKAKLFVSCQFIWYTELKLMIMMLILML